MFMSAQAGAKGEPDILTRGADTNKESERGPIAVAQSPVVPTSGSQRAVDAVLQLAEIEEEFTDRGYFWPHERSVRELTTSVGTEFLLFAGLQQEDVLTSEYG